jgi:hypothetical protein
LANKKKENVSITVGVIPHFVKHNSCPEAATHIRVKIISLMNLIERKCALDGSQTEI